MDLCREFYFKPEPESVATSMIGLNEIRLYDGPDHHADFLECVRTRRQTAAPVEQAHRSAALCHLASIVTLLGRKVRWDAGKERFINDAEADRMLVRSMRAPWHM